jgi:beta-glucosidase
MWLSCALVIIPNGENDTHWAKVSVPSEGREAVDRQSVALEQEELIKQVYQANPKTIVVLISISHTRLIGPNRTFPQLFI